MGQRVQLSGEAQGSPDRSSGKSLAVGEIYRVIYFSDSLLPPLQSGGEKEIEAILEASRRRNRTLGLTGALTFNEDHFAQVLEGRRREVGEIFARIAGDPRHRNILVIEEGWIVKRDFAQWAMAYVADEGSSKVISSNLQLRDIIVSKSNKALALIEMLKFFLSPGD